MSGKVVGSLFTGGRNGARVVLVVVFCARGKMLKHFRR